MSLIGPVSQDAAIAPRTGSGSPQSQPQQRADAAPAVVSDSPAARADPGVMLKVVPPVQERTNNLSVTASERQIAESLLGRVLAETPLDEDALRDMVFSGRRADEAFLSRMTAWLASLPEETQSAIRSAKSPEIARLLKIAALTEPGLKTAPAVIIGVGRPLAGSIDDAMSQLLILLRQAQPFRVSALLEQLATALPVHQDQFSPSSEEARFSKTALQQTSLRGQTTLGLEAADPERNSPQAEGAEPLKGSLTARGMTTFSPDIGSLISKAGPSDPVGTVFQVNRSDQIVNNLEEIASGELSPPQQLGSTGPVNAKETLQHAVLDAMKLVMDGRLIWTGQLVPGTHARVERSDAWQANRRAPGGMEKGTAIRISLELPSFGTVEVRALSFSGHVTARVFTDARATTTFVEAMPKLQQLLRSKGLNGVNVVVESK